MTIARILAGLRQRGLSALYQLKPQDTYILMLHEVTAGEQPQHPSLSITRDNLERMLDQLDGAGISIVPISAIHADTTSPRAVLTFDDIFFNACENAFPLLRQRSIPYCVFITAAYIDTPGFITSRQLEQLKQDPLCTIGYHCNTHDMMRNLTNAQIDRATDASSFETRWGVHCEYFAFPYGSVYACPGRAIKIAASHNYRAVFSTIAAGTCTEAIRRNPWFIPRLCVSDNSWHNLFHTQE